MTYTDLYDKKSNRTKPSQITRTRVRAHAHTHTHMYVKYKVIVYLGNWK